MSFDMQCLASHKGDFKAGAMKNVNGVHKRNTFKPVRADLDGPVCSKEWEYSSVVGMFKNLEAKTCPEISNEVHQNCRSSKILRIVDLKLMTKV